uniref:Uncharacterized protein n=1 Tax=Oryza nivara TaxID=4536 RepID=A0A0E0I8V2_ORYNI
MKPMAATVQRAGSPASREDIRRKKTTVSSLIARKDELPAIFGLREGDAGYKHSKGRPSAATARAGTARLDGEGLPKDEDEGDVTTAHQ